jgi:hypothetical protein
MLALHGRSRFQPAPRNACRFATRIVGYINAPAIWQWVVAACPEATVDVSEYQRSAMSCATH